VGVGRASNPAGSWAAVLTAPTTFSSRNASSAVWIRVASCWSSLDQRKTDLACKVLKIGAANAVDRTLLKLSDSVEPAVSETVLPSSVPSAWKQLSLVVVPCCV
jgi:hypothetical protein